MWLAAGSALLLLAAAVAAHAQLDSAVPVTSPVPDDRSTRYLLVLYIFFSYLNEILSCSGTIRYRHSELYQYPCVNPFTVCHLPA